MKLSRDRENYLLKLGESPILFKSLFLLSLVRKVNGKTKGKQIPLNQIQIKFIQGGPTQRESTTNMRKF